ncbi:MAG: FAD-dependent oxidoreductase [Actinomycetota bacterium]
MNPAMQHTATGWWLQEAGGAKPTDPLAVDRFADVLIVGGGYLGMWTAWHLIQGDPAMKVAILESEVCGHGPSGRNGGMVNSVAALVPDLRAKHGDLAARALLDAANDSVHAIGIWCEEQGVDAWYRAAAHLDVETSEFQDAGWDEIAAACAAIGATDEVALLDSTAVAQICRSDCFAGGATVKTSATVQPARLALGLRAKLIEHGVSIYEHSRVASIRVDRAAVVARTFDGAGITAPTVVLALGGRALRVPALGRRLSVASSHIVVTEPVPDVIAAAGWTGGEGITDQRTLLHYFRTTRDGRIVMGWGGGQMAFASRMGGRIEVDPSCAEHAVATLKKFFPELANRAVTHAWGGPIDVSPTHLPFFGSLGPRVHYGVGFTGNGVGPSHLGGRILASIACDRRDDLTRLAIVEPDHKTFPPEPLRWIGGSAIRAALIRKDSAEDGGGRTDPITEAITRLPKLLGMNLPR